MTSRNLFARGDQMDEQALTVHAWAQAAIAIILLLMLAIVGIWDVYALTMLPPGYSISYVIQRWSMGYPVLPMAAGMVVGHLFWPLR